MLRLLQFIILACVFTGLLAAQEEAFEDISVAYDQKARPLLESHCLSCHDSETTKGDLDLERFDSLDGVRADPATWQGIVEQVTSGEMPPKDKKQLSSVERAQLLDWASRYLDAEALASAGDPGPVVLRRLSNAEYTYTVHDLTSVPTLDPVREFPVDSAAGEGFTNMGDALAMSPALLEKYLGAGKEIASHVVLLPEGFRFSDKDTRRDWSNAIVDRIRRFYHEVLQAESIDFGYTKGKEVGGIRPVDESEGRLDHGRYLSALIEHREGLLADVSVAEDIARRVKLNPKYFGLLARMLTSPDDGSVLLDGLRERWQSVDANANALREWVQAWQDQLWRFRSVGHLGVVQPWQVANDPVTARRELQLKLQPTLTLVANGAEGDVVKWESPRIVRPRSRPMRLRDVRAVSTVFEKFREETLAQTAKFLELAFRMKASKSEKMPDDDSLELKLFLSYLGVSTSNEVAIQDYLHGRIKKAGGYDSLQGWSLPGVGDLSLLGNASDTLRRIPGEAPPHRVVVHPRPERWIAAGWKSPIHGEVKISAHVQDRHGGCGNGVRWSLEHRRGNQRRVLRADDLNVGATAAIAPIERLGVEAGDLISVIIDAREGNHACDLTEIEFSLTELEGKLSSWSLAADCADSMLAGNPHADRHGNLDVWHFYTGTGDGSASWQMIPEKSILSQWFAAKDPGVASRLGEQLQAFLTNPLPEVVSEEDRLLYDQMTMIDGPLFAKADFAALAKSAIPEDVAASTIGLDPNLFDADGHLIVTAPSRLTFTLPDWLMGEGDLQVSGQMVGDGRAQLQLTGGSAESSDALIPGIPFTANAGSSGALRLRNAFAGFREFFPAAMCYARVVPIDEVVTLLLYHREDSHLARLMLDDDEQEQLDRLWNELHYVSKDAFQVTTALEQILEFATQDADPSRFYPLQEPIAKSAAVLEERLLGSEPSHLEALVKFAARGYRRLLSVREEHGLLALYHSLRAEDRPHEEAFRLTLARVFASPAFLYRAEEPVANVKQGPISPWEQATRLSYFLWSSTPDEALREAAAKGDLLDPDKLLSQAQRMLKDPRTRRLAVQFACQWLHVRDFDQFDEKNERLFPGFAKLRGSMYEEVIRYFEDLFQNDGSVLSILDADHSFVDTGLAEFYGLPISDSDGWRRVEGLRGHGRGGVLGMASTLARQSGASRTSPILRGNWVSETLLGERLPKPPNDVPPLPETLPEGLSERELIARHSSDPACAKCHARIDPLGFALESFDAVGRFRESMDTRTVLQNGTALEGIAGLRNYLLGGRRETFVRHFCRKLLGFSLARGVRLSDEPLLDDMITQLAANDYRFTVAVECIVRSRQFREIRGQNH